METEVTGLLLAAGAGRRMGQPKALVREEDGSGWLVRSIQTLLDGGCARVVVVLGASADEAGALLRSSELPADSVTAVECPDWQEGMGASLRFGLTGLTTHSASLAALVHLVDLPDVGPDVIARVLGDSAAEGRLPAALMRASYGGRAGHPVLLGRDHWAGVVEAAIGDQGARGYLAAHPPRPVECGDLAGGVDVDTALPTDDQHHHL